MVCQRMSEKKLGHDGENQWRRFLSEATAVWVFFCCYGKKFRAGWINRKKRLATLLWLRLRRTVVVKSKKGVQGFSLATRVGTSAWNQIDG